MATYQVVNRMCSPITTDTVLVIGILPSQDLANVGQTVKLVIRALTKAKVVRRIFLNKIRMSFCLVS